MRAGIFDVLSARSKPDWPGWARSSGRKSTHASSGPSLRTCLRNREQGGALVKVVAAGHARRVTLTSATACFIARLKFEGKG